MDPVQLVVRIFVSFRNIWNSAPLNFPRCVPFSVRLPFACLLPRSSVSLYIAAVFWNNVTFIINIFQMKPSRSTLLLSVFISTSVHVSDNYVPIVRRTYCIYATLVFFTLYGWLSGLQTSWSGIRVAGFSLQHGYHSKQPHRNSNTHHTKNNTTNVVIQQNSRKLLMMDTLMSETCWAHKKWNKITSGIKFVFYSSTREVMFFSANRTNHKSAFWE